MQKIETICDICKRSKGESNHWWKVWQDAENFQLIPATLSFEDKIEYQDLCSEACATKALSRFMMPPVKGANADA